MLKRRVAAALLAALSAGPALAAGEARNIIFFLGDGTGPTIITAARIFQYREEGLLHFERMERSARIKTYAQDAQTTDSSSSMGSYMTGQKMNNEVMAMNGDTIAILPGKDANGNLSIDNCGADNGRAIPTILELAKANGKAVGAVTTTELTHATPGNTFAHSCHRQSQHDIARQIVPGGAGFNPALGEGVDVLMGGGRNHFTPYHAIDNPGGRADGRDLIAEMQVRGYTVASTRAEMLAAPNQARLLGLYSSKNHLEYELDRTAVPPLGEGATQPSLAEMAVKAIEVLSQNSKGYFLLVEGGRIDHALHQNNARRALVDTIAMDDAFKAVLDKLRQTDPQLKETLIVLTSDHDHTLSFNGYNIRGNPVLDLSRSYRDGLPSRDAEGNTYTTLMFGNGPNRPAVRKNLDSATVLADNYQQEAGVRLGSETHGGGDVKLFATGAGSQGFKGTMENTRVFHLMRSAFGF